MKNILPVLSLISFFIFSAQFSSAQADENSHIQGQIFECRVVNVQPSSVVGKDAKVEMPSSFYLYASPRATSITRVLLHLNGNSVAAAKGEESYHYAIYIYKSSENSNQFKLRGELHNLQSGMQAAMTNTGPLKMSFEMDQVRGSVSCAPSRYQYAFVNMETSVEPDATEIQDADSLTVSWVSLLQDSLLKQGFIETVKGGSVGSIGSAFQADRTCVTGNAEIAAGELKRSSAFINQDSLTVNANGLQFRTDRVVGCEQTSVGPSGDVFCKVPKLQKNGAVVRIPYCD